MCTAALAVLLVIEAGDSSSTEARISSEMSGASDPSASRWDVGQPGGAPRPARGGIADGAQDLPLADGDDRAPRSVRFDACVAEPPRDPLHGEERFSSIGSTFRSVHWNSSNASATSSHQRWSPSWPW